MSIFYLLGVLLLPIIIAYIVLSRMAQRLLTPYKLADYQFVDAQGNAIDTVSTIMNEPSIQISLVIPAYNEEKRISHMLNVTHKYLQSRQDQDSSYTYEMIVVDDGSKDGTISVVQQFMRDQNCTSGRDWIRLVPLKINRGKGFAVKQGVLRSRGKHILMVDADAATEISDLKNLEAKLPVEVKTGYGIAVGSRAHMEEGVKRDRKWYRNLLMHGFHFLVTFVGGIWHIRDTQCGFKLFTRNSARDIFLNLHIDRWCFDIDLLRIAHHFAMPIVEIPVNWQDIDGSKLKLSGMIHMGIDLALIRLFYTLGFWKIESKLMFA